MALQKREFTRDSGSVDTYENVPFCFVDVFTKHTHILLVRLCNIIKDVSMSALVASA